jgi:hypothetical protein
MALVNDDQIEEVLGVIAIQAALLTTGTVLLLWAQIGVRFLLP